MGLVWKMISKRGAKEGNTAEGCSYHLVVVISIKLGNLVDQSQLSPVRHRVSSIRDL